MRGMRMKNVLAALGLPLVLVALLTVALGALSRFVDVETVTTIYLIPVLVGAIRGGVVPAVITAISSMAAAAFFFYPPIYDFRVHNPIHVIDLVLFIIVAVVTGQLAANVRKARMREQADVLREALIGSVSHELRTPLSTVLGTASVLAQSQEIAASARLAPLVQGLREEAERLNDHIQNLLDASRISSEGIRPQSEWIDPGDVVNTAVEHKRRLLSGHQVKVTVPEDLPLLQVEFHLDRAGARAVDRECREIFPAAFTDRDQRRSDRRYGKIRRARPRDRVVGGRARPYFRALLPQPASQRCRGFGARPVDCARARAGVRRARRSVQRRRRTRRDPVAPSSGAAAAAPGTSRWRR